jgi:undecaprenyl-diphosphatase
MVEWILKIDYWIFEKINHAGSFGIGDVFFPWITDLNKSVIFFVIAIPLMFFIFFRKFGKKGITYFLILLVAVGTSDFVGRLVKDHYTRSRPFDNPEITAIQRSPAGGKSFYSNHSSNMFTIAAYTSPFFPQLTIPFFVVASLVAYSRIYNGVHYPSDVLAGILAGLFWGFIFSWLAKKLVQRFQQKGKSP